MATLASRFSTLTAPGTTGDQVVSITTGGSWPASTTPKVVMLWTSYRTAHSAAGQDFTFVYGWGTFDGGAAQNVYAAMHADNGGAARPSGACNSNAILRGLVPSSSGTAADFAATFVSFGSDQFTINWSDLPATGSILVHYLVLGGDAIDQARAFTVTGNNAATQDVTVVAGFGQPNLVFLGGGGGDALTAGISGAFNLGIGASTFNGAQQQCSWIWEEDGVGTNNVFLRQINQMIVTRATAFAGSTVTDQATLSTSSWPTDGFEISWSNTSANSYIGLAIRGTNLNVAVGTISTSTTLNATTSFTAGFTPGCALVWGGNMPSSASDISADSTALLVDWGIGAYDGTNEGHASGTIDDAGTTGEGGSSSNTKGIQILNPTSTVRAEADLTFSGNDVVATWTDPDTIASEKNILVLGAVAGGGGGATTRPVRALMGVGF